MTEQDESGQKSVCSTTNSFKDHGIADATSLVTDTYYRLRAAEQTGFSTDDAFFDRLESAFIWSYLSSVDEAGIPDHVQFAIEDARELTRDEFTEKPDADLRTDVLPAFYRRLAGFHCVYRD